MAEGAFPHAYTTSFPLPHWIPPPPLFPNDTTLEHQGVTLPFPQGDTLTLTNIYITRPATPRLPPRPSPPLWSPRR